MLASGETCHPWAHNTTRKYCDTLTSVPWDSKTSPSVMLTAASCWRDVLVASEAKRLIRDRCEKFINNWRCGRLHHVIYSTTLKREVTSCDIGKWSLTHKMEPQLKTAFTDSGDYQLTENNAILRRHKSVKRRNDPRVRVRSESWSELILISIGAMLRRVSLTDNQYDEDDDEITPDLWQEACWIVIR